MSTHASHVALSAPSGWGVGSLLRFARRVHERRQAAATFAKLGTFGSDSFGWSGYGAPRIGPESLRRFLRRKSLLSQHGEVADIQDDHHLGKPGA